MSQSNRALAHSKLGDHAAAVAACDEALTLSPGHVKVLYRKGTAHVALAEFRAAKEAFQQGLAAEPENKTLAAGLKKCQVGV
jgi:predicted TPR repeat methyltransferase